jgi:hypothetical protein
MKNKQVKQMICDAVMISCNGNCGSIFWESTSDFIGKHGYGNELLIVDGMHNIEYSFWYHAGVISLTADQLKGK